MALLMQPDDERRDAIIAGGSGVERCDEDAGDLVHEWRRAVELQASTLVSVLGIEPDDDCFLDARERR